jgi:GDPmannose 4,6-dehydratase
VTAVVFGANGQDGHYLIEELRQRGLEVVGISRSGPWRRGDVSHRQEVEDAVRALRPSLIFHLAANSTVRHEAQFENHETISTGTLNVLEAAWQHCPEARVFLAGSGLQFRNDGSPIDEQAPFEAGSPYAVARIQSVYAARYYRSKGLRAYVGYLFHHDSPRRGPRHVSQLVVSAVRRIAGGSAETLELNDVTAVKEWTFAGDVARGMVMLLEQDAVHEAVIGSGQGHSVQDWVERCFALAGLRWQDHVRAGTGRSEFARLISNPTLMKSLGWSPRVGFDQLSEMMMAAQES